LFELKPNEVYVDTFTVQDFNMKGLDYNFAFDIFNFLKNIANMKKK
jgi:hypothetical protein